MQALLVSFLMREVLLVVGVVMEVLDYTSDLLVFLKVLGQASVPEVEPLVVPYCNPLLQPTNQPIVDSTAKTALLTVCLPDVFFSIATLISGSRICCLAHKH